MQGDRRTADAFTPDEDFDSADLDALIELMRSRGYMLVEKRLMETLERKRLDLERDGKDVQLLRGEISALRVAIGIPAILKDEIKASL